MQVRVGCNDIDEQALSNISDRLISMDPKVDGVDILDRAQLDRYAKYLLLCLLLMLSSFRTILLLL
jgi:hypothetical protein